MQVYTSQLIRLFFKLLLAGLLLGGGLYYEITTDSVVQAFMYGSFTNGSNALPDTFGCYVLLSSFINKLHLLYPAFGWYDVFHLLLLSAGYAAMIHLLLFKLPVNRPIAFTLAIVLGYLVAGVFFNPAEFTKTAIFLSGVALAGWYKNGSWCLSFFYGGLFFIALLLRIEAGVLGFAIAGLLLLGQTEGTAAACWKHVKRSVVPFLLVLFVSVLVNYPRTAEDAYYQNVRPYEFAITDFDRHDAPLRLGSAEDSVIYHAGVKFFFADSSRSNIRFFQKVGVAQVDKTPLSLLYRFTQGTYQQRKGDVFLQILYTQKWMLAIVALLTLLAIGLGAYRVALSTLFALLVVAFISLLLKPETHVISPVLAIIILLNGAWLSKHSFWQSSIRMQVLMTLAISLFSAGEIHRQQQRVQAEALRHAYYQKVARYAADLKQGPKLLQIGTWDEAHRKMFQQDIFISMPDMYVIDGAIIYFNREYQKMMRELTGQASFIGQWKYFATQPGTIIVSPRERMDMILTYINTIYKTNYAASSQHTFEAPPPGCQLIEVFKITAADSTVTAN